MRRGVVFRLVFGLFVVATIVAGGAYAYHLGVAHGLAEAGALAGGASNVPPRAWAWHPWGFGFFPFFPLLFVLLALAVLRGHSWRGGWYRGCADHGVPRPLEEWHRRAHEQQARPSEPETRA